MNESLQSQLDALFVTKPKHTLNSEVHTCCLGEQHHIAEILHEVRQHKHAPGMHIGIAGFANFDIAGAAKSNAVLLCDLNQNQVLFWRSIIAMLAEHYTPDAFCRAFETQLEKPDQFHLLKPEAGQEKVTLRYADIPNSSPTMFLDKQEWLKPSIYSHLHRLAKTGHMATVTLDILDREQCTALHEALGKCELDGAAPKVGTVYGSNVFDLVQPHPGIMLSYAFSNLLHLVGNHLVSPEMPMEDHQKAIAQAQNEFTQFLLAEELTKERGRNGRKKVSQAEIKRYAKPLFNAFVRAASLPEIEELAAEYELLTKENCRLPEMQAMIYALDQRLYNSLTLDSGISSEMLEKMGMLSKDNCIIYSVAIPAPKHVSYASLRALATDDDTLIFGTSIRTRPLVKFAGPDSPRAWRDKIASEATADAPSLR